MTSDIAIGVTYGIEPERSLMGLDWCYDPCQPRVVSPTWMSSVSRHHASLIVIITLNDMAIHQLHVAKLFSGMA